MPLSSWATCQLYRTLNKASKSFENRGTVGEAGDVPLDEDTIGAVPSGGDPAKLRANRAAADNGTAKPILSDPEGTYVKCLGIMHDLVRFHEGEHPFVCVCARCEKICVICAIATTSAGELDQRLGWWVAIPANTPRTASALHAAVACAPLHVECTHGL